MAEFTAVVLAGGSGHRLFPLTETTPKSLLPIANKPLVSFQLEYLERHGFSETIVVTSETAHTAMEKFLAEFYRGRLQIQLVTVPDSSGTADALRAIRDRVQSDLIVISGDLITTASLRQLADLHRVEDSAITIALKHNPPVSEATAAMKKSKGDPEMFDFVGLDEHKRRVLLLAASADVEDEGLKLSKNLLRRYPRLTVSSNLTDVHLYCIKRWVLDFLDEKKAITSIKEELVPYLVQKQFSPKFQGQAARYMPASQHAQSYLGASSLSLGDSEELDAFRCSALILDPSVYCQRANSLQSYAELNKELATSLNPSNPGIPSSLLGRVMWELPRNHLPTDNQSKSQIGSDCAVGEGLQIGERCSVKRSVIGHHCRLGSRVKINNSVILDHVTIDQDCMIQNSIISSDVHIQAKCNLKDCIIGPSYTLPSESDLKNETLTLAQDDGM